MNEYEFCLIYFQNSFVRIRMIRGEFLSVEDDRHHTTECNDQSEGQDTRTADIASHDAVARCQGFDGLLGLFQPHRSPFAMTPDCFNLLPGLYEFHEFAFECIIRKLGRQGSIQHPRFHELFGFGQAHPGGFANDSNGFDLLACRHQFAQAAGKFG
jgi:hypothetical protein